MTTPTTPTFAQRLEHLKRTQPRPRKNFQPYKPSIPFKNPPELESLLIDIGQFPQADKYDLTIQITSRNETLTKQHLSNFMNSACELFMQDNELKEIVKTGETTCEAITSNYTFLHFLLKKKFKNDAVIDKMVAVFKQCSKTSDEVFIMLPCNHRNAVILKMVYPVYMQNEYAVSLAEEMYAKFGTIMQIQPPQVRGLTYLLDIDVPKELHVLIDLSSCEIPEKKCSVSYKG